MTNDELYDNLYRGISKIAWGYVFVFCNINLGTLNILPNFVGFLMFLSAISLLQEVEPELALLRPFGIALSIWYVMDWLCQLFSVSLTGGLLLAVNVVICIMSIYFQFQLLTNLASIAVKYQSTGAEFDVKLLRYRNIQVVAITGAMILTYLIPQWLGDGGTFLVLIWTAASLIVGICILVTLFGFRKAFREL